MPKAKPENEMELSYREIVLMLHILNYTGEKETDPRMQEVDVPRRLSGEESAQRRHFYSNNKDFIEDVEKQEKEAREAHAKRYQKEKDALLKKNPTLRPSEVEAELNSNVDLLDSIKKYREEKERLGALRNKFALTEKTLLVVRKYFNEYSNVVGFVAADDENATNLSNALGIE